MPNISNESQLNVSSLLDNLSKNRLSVTEVARSMGINKSLLSKYIYGIKKPSDIRKMQIKEALHLLGKELLAV